MTKSKSKILIQLDSDAHASSFDAVVAIDSGVDSLVQYSRVQAQDVRSLVHGAIFTRGPQDLRNTAVFVGGSNVDVGETILKAARESCFGPMRVSMMLDANGANTTAAAAVLAIERHFPLAGISALVLAATGPVGQRVVRLLARAGATVRAASRSEERAREVCDSVRKRCEKNVQVSAHGIASDEQLERAIAGVQVVVAAGAAGIQLLPKQIRSKANDLKMAVDLNAVPPLGIEGMDVMDKAVEREGTICYGAIGVGGTKMKIHKAAIQRLFESNDQVLDAEQIFELGRELARSPATG